MSDFLKRCPNCNTVYDSPLFFYKDKTTKDGFNYRCKECTRKYAKQFISENKERIYEKNREYQKNNREKINEMVRNHYHANPEKRQLYGRTYHHAHKEEIKERKRKYNIEHPEVYFLNYSKRRAAKAGGGGSHTAAQWQYVKEVNGNRCIKCFKPESEVKLTKDHIVPISQGGSDNIGNIQPLCLSCNVKKRAKIEDYRGRRVSRGKLRKSD